MKTRRILAASTAALLSFASVAVVASAEDTNAPDPNVPGPNDPGPNVPGPNDPGPNVPGPNDPVTTPAVDIADIDEDGVDIGDGVKAIIDEKTAEKFGENFNITASPVAVKAGENDKGGNVLVADDSDVVNDLSKNLKKEISRIKMDEFAIYDIALADGDYVETTAPAAIKFTVNVPFDAKVYHVNGDSVEKLKSTSKKRTDGTYDVSFSTKTFSPFIFTTADLKNAKATNASNDPVDSGASNADGTNPSTGIALAIAPVVLAAGAVAVVALKKKH